MRKFIKINPSFFAVVIIIHFLGFLKEYILMFLILAFHEISHLVAICYQNIKVNYIKIEPFGITIRLKEKVFDDPQKEIIMAASGPLFNLLIAFLAQRVDFLKFSFFIYANLSMGLFNLLPIYPLDGGRILKAILSKKYGYLKSYKFVLMLTKMISVIMVVVGIWTLFLTKFNFSVLLTGCFLFFNVLTEKNYSYFYLVKEISEFKKKEKEIEKMPVTALAVTPEFSVLKILGDLSFIKYYVFYVIENGKKIKELTESELIDGMIKKNAKIKIKDLL